MFSSNDIEELKQIIEFAKTGKSIIKKHNKNKESYFIYRKDIPVSACYLGCALIGKEGLHSIKEQKYLAPFLHWKVLRTTSYMQTGQNYRGFAYPNQNDLHDKICNISDELGFDETEKFLLEFIKNEC